VDSFRYHPSLAFARKLESLQRRDPPGYRHVQRTIERLLLHPDDSDGRLTGPHHGKLKKYAGRSGYRVIYNWCRACRRANQHLSHACGECERVTDRSVVFLDLFHKSDHHKLGY
jgi:mRNA-degrading endonuclease RelE of RelBE toxin-antitoxin system